jgi:hypothetical protein
MNFKNFMKNSWAIWAIIIPIIILNIKAIQRLYIKDGLEIIAYSFVFWFLYVPIICFIGLILNIKKNKKNKTPLIEDWKFWLWVVPSVGGLGFFMIVLIRTLLM